MPAVRRFSSFSPASRRLENEVRRKWAALLEEQRQLREASINPTPRET